MPKTETDTEPKLPGMPGPSKKQIGRAIALDDAIEGLHTAITEYDFPPGCIVKLEKHVKGDFIQITYKPGEA